MASTTEMYYFDSEHGHKRQKSKFKKTYLQTLWHCCAHFMKFKIKQHSICGQKMAGGPHTDPQIISEALESAFGCHIFGTYFCGPQCTF